MTGNDKSVFQVTCNRQGDKVRENKLENKEAVFLQMSRLIPSLVYTMIFLIMFEDKISFFTIGSVHGDFTKD